MNEETEGANRTLIKQQTKNRETKSGATHAKDPA